jgi:hypothetical protein
MCYKRKQKGRAVAQAVSRWLPTAAAWVRVRATCGICGGQSGTGACFLRVLRFPLPIISPISPSSYSPGAGTIGLLVAAVPSGPNWTPPPLYTLQKAKSVYNHHWRNSGFWAVALLRWWCQIASGHRSFGFRSFFLQNFYRIVIRATLNRLFCLCVTSVSCKHAPLPRTFQGEGADKLFAYKHV